jgi:hypothetical protein
LRISEKIPTARWLHTFNNHENEWMLRVNHEPGYKTAEGRLTFEFPLAECP